VTVFGTPNDVTLAELALEMLFPADDRTVEIVRSMVREQVELGHTAGSPAPRLAGLSRRS
jgi:hypothetical protein